MLNIKSGNARSNFSTYNIIYFFVQKNKINYNINDMYTFVVIKQFKSKINVSRKHKTYFNVLKNTKSDK